MIGHKNNSNREFKDILISVLWGSVLKKDDKTLKKNSYTKKRVTMKFEVIPKTGGDDKCPICD